MSHHHDHAASEKLTSLSGIYILTIVLNLAFVLIEAGVGFYAHSLGLLSDAGHNLSDVFSLLLALVAFMLTRVAPRKGFTYGYKKASVLISLLNAIILLVAVGMIIVESIHKFTDPSPVSGAAVSWTAGAGIVVNGLSTWLLHLKKGKDLNAQGAFLHMLADTLVSIGVVVAGVIISLTGIYIIDPIISLIIVVVILASTWHLLSASLRLSLDGIPEDIDPDEIERKILQVPHVESLHHVHIWALSTEENALTAHIVVDRPENIDEAKHAIREVLAANDIAHATLEMEHHGEQCTCPCD
jgi:cobalt-zinc-cadmium efflux system protein